MITHYLHTALRHYRRYRYSTIANILCVSFGLTCFLCAYSVFAYFASAESGFKNADKIYTIKTQFITNGEPGIETIGVPYPVAKKLESVFPQIKGLSLTTGTLGPVWPKTVSAGDKSFDGIMVMAADDGFFRLFDIPVIDGDVTAAMNSPGGVVIGAALASKMFGTTKVAGRTITLNGNIPLEIRAVTGTLPTPTHLALIAGRDEHNLPSLDLIIPWSVYKALARNDIAIASTVPISPSADVIEETYFPQTVAYFIMPKGSWTFAQMNVQLQKTLDDAFKNHSAAFGEDKVSFRVTVIPVRNALSEFVKSTARILNLPIVPILVVLGTLLLGVAIINFINLYTTQLISARKELGIMQLLGATRWFVITQCFVETFIICLAAMILALLIFIVLRPTISFIDFNTTWLSGSHFLLALAIILLGVALLATSYPAILVSGISPRDTLQERIGHLSGKRLSQLLVALQFAVAGTLLVLLVVIQKESAELHRLALGRMDASAIIINNNLFKSGVNYKTLASELLRHPEIKDVAMADGGLYSQGFSFDQLTLSLNNNQNARRIRVDYRRISSNFFNVMNLSLLAGHDFESAHDMVIPSNLPANITTIPHADQVVDVIVDANFVGLMSAAYPQDIIGKLLRGHSYLPPNMRIIGVVENSFQGMNGTYNEATVFTQDVKDGLVIAKISEDKQEQALGIVDSVWKQLAPNATLSRGLIVDRYKMNSGALFQFFSIILSLLITLAVAISVMGMIGMASHTIVRRTREISIRKSMGASTADIIQLLLKYFAIPVIIANILIAWPLGWLASRAYLSLFPYHTSITAAPFMISIGIIVIIVCGAVLSQTLRAATRKPAEVLRYE